MNIPNRYCPSLPWEAKGKVALERALLVYGRPYGGVPYGRFSDRSFFSYFSKFFVVFLFQEKNFEKKNSKFFLEQQELFSRKKNRERKIFQRKNLERGTFKRKKLYETNKKIQ